MTSKCPKRRRAKRTRSLMAERTPCLRRCSTISVASPNQEGVERTDWEDVWMITDPSAILFIGASLMECFCSSFSKRHILVSTSYRLHLVAHPVGYGTERDNMNRFMYNFADS